MGFNPVILKDTMGRQGLRANLEQTYSLVEIHYML